jgi:nitroreductase
MENGLSAIQAVLGRKSIRRFTDQAVDEDVVWAILTGAARAPSGTNFQPWKVHVVTGDSRARLSEAVRGSATGTGGSLEYSYIPDEVKEPYLSRRRKIGYDLYALYGIDREDRPARAEAMLRNFDFFGAPVGLFVTMDRALTIGQWLDCGMFLQNIMILARAYGLETCPQQAWCDYGDVVRQELGIAEDHIILTGLALGNADWSAPENSLVTEREPATAFTLWHR